MKIKWSLDINTGAVERSEAARARSLAGATVGGAKYPSIFGVGVPNTLGYLEWGCKISRGAKYPVTPGQMRFKMAGKFKTTTNFLHYKPAYNGHNALAKRVYTRRNG